MSANQNSTTSLDDLKARFKAAEAKTEASVRLHSRAARRKPAAGGVPYWPGMVLRVSTFDGIYYRIEAQYHVEAAKEIMADLDANGERITGWMPVEGTKSMRELYIRIGGEQEEDKTNDLELL